MATNNESFTDRTSEVKTRNGKRILFYTSALALFSTFFFLFFGLHAAEGASLYLSPSSGSFTVGRTFSINVLLSSPSQAMNAAEGVISFPSDKIQVVSFSKSGSIFNLWVREPSFSNTAGTVSFEGVVLNPGFVGSGGKLLTITFRARDAGSAPVTFGNGAILANDGMGTNILSSFGNANYFINPSGKTEEKPVPVSKPVAPQVSSPTHPDSNKWYPLKDAKFTWPLEKGITGTRIIVTRFADANPNKTSIPAIDSKEITDLEDGIWYFNVQLRNKSGWGEIARFRFQVDATPPDSLTIAEVERKRLTESKVKFILNASDKTSGIDYYEIQIDGGIVEVWKDDGSHTYQTSALDPGEHILNVKAVDKAGNFVAKSHQFSVEKREISLLLILLIILVVILAVSLMVVSYRLAVLRRRLRGDLRQAESNLRLAFIGLHQEVRRQIRTLNNVRTERELTSEELRLIEELEHALDNTELIVAKELDKIDEMIK